MSVADRNCTGNSQHKFAQVDVLRQLTNPFVHHRLGDLYGFAAAIRGGKTHFLKQAFQNRRQSPCTNIFNALVDIGTQVGEGFNAGVVKF